MYHGRIKEVRHLDQSWTLVIELPDRPDYAIVFDNVTFALFYSRITGGANLSYDLIHLGESAIPRYLLRQRIFTSGLLSQPCNGGIQ